jgi:hypothetical protein
MLGSPSSRVSKLAAGRRRLANFTRRYRHRQTAAVVIPVLILVGLDRAAAQGCGRCRLGQCLKMTCGRQLGRPLSHCVGSPNSKPPLVVAGRAIIDPDIRVTSSRELVEASDLHFFLTPTCRQFSATGYQ